MPSGRSEFSPVLQCRELIRNNNPSPVGTADRTIPSKLQSSLRDFSHSTCLSPGTEVPGYFHGVPPGRTPERLSLFESRRHRRRLTLIQISGIQADTLPIRALAALRNARIMNSGLCAGEQSVPGFHAAFSCRISALREIITPLPGCGCAELSLSPRCSPLCIQVPTACLFYQTRMRSTDSGARLPL
jgi:hypothetical protein